MANFGPVTKIKVSDVPPGSFHWNVFREAYMEVLLDLPPNFDRDWQAFGARPTQVRPTQNNYEIARQACLTLALRGELPSWRKNAKIPTALAHAQRAIKQEIRLGKELNLCLNLAPTPAAGQDLPTIY